MVFKPGQSGNPGGRHKGIASLAREHADRAISVLAEGLDSDNERIRLDAASLLLDRGFGKAIAMTADVTRKLDELGDDELAAGIDAVKSALGIAEADASGTGTETTH